MKKQINSYKRMQQLAGLLIENESSQVFKPTENVGFNNFVEKIATEIFTAGVNDPMMVEVDNWDTLFEFFMDFGNLYLFTQHDIETLAQESGVSQDDIDYIMDLPQVQSIERG